MAKGWLNEGSRPAGRRLFSDHPGYVKPGTHDGLPTAVTPGAVRAGRLPTYDSAEAQAYREHLRDAPSRRPANPTVTSKATGKYGVDGSKVDFPYSSTGQQPADMRRHLAGELHSDSPITHVGTITTPHVETVGHQPDGSGFRRATHPVSEARGHTNAVKTSPESRSVGMQFQKSGGARGEAPSRPASGGPHAGQRTEPLGNLNQHRDRNLQEGHARDLAHRARKGEGGRLG